MYGTRVHADGRDLGVETAGLSLDPGVRSDGRIGDEVVKDARPGRVLRDGVVEFGRDSLDLGQEPARDGREVVMFVVVAHVEGDPVEGPIVRVRFEALGEHVYPD